MKQVLNDYIKIFLSCPLGALMQVARDKMKEDVQAWAKTRYEEMPTLAEVEQFIDTCAGTPIYPKFVDKVLVPLIIEEEKVGKQDAANYLEELKEEGIMIEEII